MNARLQIPNPERVDYEAALSSIRLARLQQSARLKVQEPKPVDDRDDWPPNYDMVHAWRRKKLAEVEQDPSLGDRMKRVYANTGWQGIVRFITHWCDVYEPRNAGTDKPTWMPLIMFPKQVELVRFVYECIMDDESGLVEKSRTMGASWVCLSVSNALWTLWPGVAIGWGSQSQEQVDLIGDMSSLFEKMRQQINRLPAFLKPKGLDPASHLLVRRLVNPETGSTITGGIGDKIGRGGRTRVYFCDEAAHYERPETIEASLSETTRVKIDLSSVNGQGNLFHRTREAGIEWVPGKKMEPGYTRVFVMDWSDHPEYDQAWYNRKKQAAVRKGTTHIFAQEIERNYAASIAGTIIKSEWVQAAFDAHEVLGIEDAGATIAALDVADGEQSYHDRNAFGVRRGIILKYLEEWAERDTGTTTRRALVGCRDWDAEELQYDCIGVGSGVKAEANRLADEGLLPPSLKMVPWNAGDKCQDPYDRIEPNDERSPRNRDIYENLKAQGWDKLANRLWLTYRAVMKALGTPLEGDEHIEFNPDELISIAGNIPHRQQLVKELCQPVWTKSGRLRKMVDKTPKGTRSPNLGDVVMMVYHPVRIRVTDDGIFEGPRIVRPS